MRNFAPPKIKNWGRGWGDALSLSNEGGPTRPIRSVGAYSYTPFLGGCIGAYHPLVGHPPRVGLHPRRGMLSSGVGVGLPLIEHLYPCYSV